MGMGIAGDGRLGRLLDLADQGYHAPKGGMIFIETLVIFSRVKLKIKHA